MKRDWTPSEETRAKMRLAKIGFVPWNKGKKGVQASWRKGKKGVFSVDTLKKMSDSHKGKSPSKETRERMRQASIRSGNKPPVMRGKDNPSWKGGITPQIHLIRYGIEYELWRNAVFARDGYACQKYGTVGGKLVAHHVLNFSTYPKLRFAIDNGVTLSEKAHLEFHKRFGRKNNTRAQLEEFLNNES